MQDRNEIITTTSTNLVPVTPKALFSTLMTGSASSPLITAPKSGTASSSDRQTRIDAAPPT